MRNLRFLLVACGLLLGGIGPPVLADWQPADGHKMHFPQLPNQAGWDVNASNPIVLADDWRCSQTGLIKDIHFWGSWMHGMDGQIISFTLSIHADIPANPPTIPYSRPGATLWERVIPITQVVVVPITTPMMEGWYDPSTGAWFANDHNMYYQYNVFLQEADWYPQDSGTIYWLNVSATLASPSAVKWGWKSTLNHWNDDAVWAQWGMLNWTDMREPPSFSQSLDLSFVINGGPEVIGACCYSDPGGANSLCVETTQNDCINNYGGVYQGDGTVCGGIQACCLSDGRCVDADSICCVNELGGTPQGDGTQCSAVEGCCMPDGSCMDLDPLCCAQLGGTPQGAGTSCSAVTIACCLTDGSCKDVDPLCCDDVGGTPSPWGAAVCLGDINGNGVDDACEMTDTCTYYKPKYLDYAPAGMPDFDQKQDNWKNPVSGAWSHCGPVALANCLWWFDSKFDTCTSPPPTVCNTYPLVDPYGLGDDHHSNNVMPFVDSMAKYCKTNQPGQSGTNVYDLAQGAKDWIDSVGLSGKYTIRVKAVERGVFGLEDIRREVLASQDVILLVGFWQDVGGGYCERIGGHFVTTAGICTDPLDSALCISDPFFDRNEGDPPPPHGAGIHNDAQFVSGPHGTIHHDKYGVIPTVCQWMTPPLFHIELAGYPINVGSVGNFVGQNQYDPAMVPIPPQPVPIHTVIEFAVIICPDTTPQPTGACCYQDALDDWRCVVTTADSCANHFFGVYEGDGTVCGGMQACCLPGGACVNADSICCVNELGGIPEGPGTACGNLQACCLPDNSCQNLDPLCCLELGGVPLGTGTQCTAPEACCLPGGSCNMLDPLCCQNMLGVPQGIGSICSFNTVVCCLPNGACANVDPLCCDDIGGTPSPWGAAACLGDGNGNGVDDACEIDTCTYYKSPYDDYAPAGMPDFDQKQDNWTSPLNGKWSWCGPVALANCIWWFDSKFESPTSPPPPAISDSYPLIPASVMWDDHDPRNVMPFVQALKPMCNTDGPWPGTMLADLENGFKSWINSAGMSDKYTTYVKLGPTFEEIRDSILACQDVILLLGFYELLPAEPSCQRIGGHYVTAAGVCQDEAAVCISDPYFDGNEGEPPVGMGHVPGVHNDAQFVSGPHGTVHHDKYHMMPIMPPNPCPSPAVFMMTDYPNQYADIAVFENQNPFQPTGPVVYNGGEIIVLVDAALIICPAEDCNCIPGDANGDAALNLADAVYVINYVFKGGPPPTPYPICSGDANCDCTVNLADAVYLINYVFKGGPAPCDCLTWLSLCGPPLRK